MKIAVNTRLLVKNKMDGIGWYAYEILKCMVRQHPDEEFIFFFDRPPHPDFIFADNVRYVVVHPQARHPILWYLFFEIGIRFALKREKPNVFFSPDGWLCLHTKTKTINVIHDLNFEHLPQFTSYINKLYLRYFFPRFAKRADILATVSHFSKEDIVKTYKIPEQKMIVAGNAVSEDFFEISNEQKHQTRLQYSNSDQYFIFVGSLHKRKNIDNILYAFDLFKENGCSFKLIFAGEKKYLSKDTEQIINQSEYKHDIIFTGYLATAEINRLVSAATGLLYVSYFEGFGVPILEAFACGTPVITSNITAMPEIAGDAALIVDPNNVDNIARAMADIATNTALRQLLIDKGKQRLKEFSWEKSADILWKAIQSLS
ncbi:MAG: glycosyltransferase family 4 protein [Bacteroidales bacterium]|jgi:glycosyltransferase involved in cell wall biosynthesis|nr:glycosyltransferase family 4 protein [Bacteroidales bacterium]